MLIINFVLCIAALTFAYLSIESENPSVMIVISYVCYALSPLTDFIDIIDRAKKGDSPGIVDIYPTFLVGYLVLLVLITLVIMIGIIKRKRSA